MQQRGTRLGQPLSRAGIIQPSETSFTRRATTAHSGSAEAVPARSSTRLASTRACAARTIAIDGTHPQYGQSPPTRRCSTARTLIPLGALAGDLQPAHAQAQAQGDEVIPVRHRASN